MCDVVHWRKDYYDIYIGRLPNNEYNKWAYPKELREQFPEGTPRKTIIDAYERFDDLPTCVDDVFSIDKQVRDYLRNS